jgi:hypothetical protein
VQHSRATAVVLVSPTWIGPRSSILETGEKVYWRSPVQITGSDHRFRTPVQITGSEHRFRTPVQNTGSERQFRTPVQNASSEHRFRTPNTGFRTPVQNTGSEHRFRTLVQNTGSEHWFRTPVQNTGSEHLTRQTRPDHVATGRREGRHSRRFSGGDGADPRGSGSDPAAAEITEPATCSPLRLRTPLPCSHPTALLDP